VHKYNGNSGPLPFWLDRTDAVKTRACILSNLAKNSERNKLIANFADVLMQKGLQTLVIGDRIAQLQEIENYLYRKGYYDIGLYISKTSDKKKRWLEKNARCILATTKMLDIGIDIDTLRGLVFATPQSEVEQVVGRVRRINPNVPEPIVIDIHDTYEESKRWARKRMKYYEREGFEVNEVDSP
jgi:superfamily II DNA or RNA helicase